MRGGQGQKTERERERKKREREKKEFEIGPGGKPGISMSLIHSIPLQRIENWKINRLSVEPIGYKT